MQKNSAPAAAENEKGERERDRVVRNVGVRRGVGTHWDQKAVVLSHDVISSLLREHRSCDSGYEGHERSFKKISIRSFLSLTTIRQHTHNSTLIRYQPYYFGPYLSSFFSCLFHFFLSLRPCHGKSTFSNIPNTRTITFLCRCWRRDWDGKQVVNLQQRSFLSFTFLIHYPRMFGRYLLFFSYINPASP